VLAQVISEIKNYPGIQRKKGISAVITALEGVFDFGSTAVPIGDDAGVIQHGSGYLLLATEEINRTLLQRDPRWAGFCSVLANVNDISAMGGTPMAMVNTASFKDFHFGKQVFEGIREGCGKYRVPMVGGHFSPDCEVPLLTVSIMGEAKKVITSFDARAEDALILATDLTGRQYKDFLHWDCITNKTPEEVANKLKVLPYIAENSLAHTAKDVSNAGIIGTLCMLLETSQKGGEIDLDAVPAPEGIYFLDWLRMYPSFGFVLSAPRENVKKIVTIFSGKGYTVRTIGIVTSDGRITLHYKGESALLFDFQVDSVFG